MIEIGENQKSKEKSKLLQIKDANCWLNVVKAKVEKLKLTPSVRDVKRNEKF